MYVYIYVLPSYVILSYVVYVIIRASRASGAPGGMAGWRDAGEMADHGTNKALSPKPTTTRYSAMCYYY